MKSVTPIPRQCSLTRPSAAKSIFTSIGMIISQISTATGRLTLAISAPPIAWNTPGRKWPRTTPATMQSATQRVRYRSKSDTGSARCSLPCSLAWPYRLAVRGLAAPGHWLVLASPRLLLVADFSLLGIVHDQIPLEIVRAVPLRTPSGSGPSGPRTHPPFARSRGGDCRGPSCRARRSAGRETPKCGSS